MALKGTDCNGPEKYYDFMSIDLKSYSDTIYFDAFIIKNASKEDCRLIGEVLLIKEK
jgi:hypothetical protein